MQMERSVPSIVKVVYFLFQISYSIDLKSHNPLLRGLTNFGNTCFLNASLQLLASSEPLIECICACNAQIKADETGEIEKACYFTIELANTLKGYDLVLFLARYHLQSNNIAFLRKFLLRIVCFSFSIF